MTHGIGLVLSLAGVAVMAAVLGSGDGWRIAGCSIYLASLIGVYLMSTLSHTFETPRVRSFFRALDQGTIYLLIAATYTPFSMAYLHTAFWWTLLAIVWSIAFWGFFSKVFFAHRVESVSMWPCIVLGGDSVRLGSGIDRCGLARRLVVDAARDRVLHGRPRVLGQRHPRPPLPCRVARPRDCRQHVPLCVHHAVRGAGAVVDFPRCANARNRRRADSSSTALLALTAAKHFFSEQRSSRCGADWCDASSGTLIFTGRSSAT